MRLKISFKIPTPSLIDVNYSYHLASAIYRAIERADPKISLELHLPSVPKFFTFSKLMIPEKRIDGDKLVVESEEVFLFFSSIRNDIAERLIEGFLMKPEIKIGSTKLLLSQIEILEEKEICEEEKFATLSPINVSKSENGKAVDLYPTQKEFYDILKQNLVKKYKLLYGKEPESKEIELKVERFKPKRIRIKNTFHRCVEMAFRAKGDPKLLEIGYKAGFGAKNSMGFGMVKVV